MKRRDGFSLVEMLISLTLVLIITMSAYDLLMRTQTVQMTESRKLDAIQGSRVTEQMLYDSIRSSGSVMDLLHTPAFLATTPPFNGIMPLNNAGYPDGIILASGDPEAVTKATSAYTPGTPTISVQRTNNSAGTAAAWAADDVGIIIRNDSYLVFKVLTAPSLGANILSVRGAAVYYAGLLNTANYDDQWDNLGNPRGNVNPYPVNSPVLRLNYFHIYLVKTEANGTKTLTLTTDCAGAANVLGATPTSTMAVPIVFNIEDLQFEYMTKADTPVSWASRTSHSDPCGAGGECSAFITNFRNRGYSSIRVYLLTKTEEEQNKSASSGGIKFSKPVMGDRAAATLTGRFHYNYGRYDVFLRNYCGIY